jgi:hypothetical protein
VAVVSAPSEGVYGALQSQARGLISMVTACDPLLGCNGRCKCQHRSYRSATPASRGFVHGRWRGHHATCERRECRRRRYGVLARMLLVGLSPQSPHRASVARHATGYIRRQRPGCSAPNKSGGFTQVRYAAPHTGTVPGVLQQAGHHAKATRCAAVRHMPGVHRLRCQKISRHLSLSCLPDCMTKRPYEDRQQYESITVRR